MPNGIKINLSVKKRVFFNSGQLTENGKRGYDFSLRRGNMEKIYYMEEPALYRPYLVLGFDGWPNAASVSSFSIEYLVENLKAKKFASMPSGNFYQTSSSRPVAIIKEGRLVELKFPGNYFYYSKGDGSPDVILFQGIEPHLRWSVFVDLLLCLAERFNVSQIFTLGGTYDYTPHTYPPMVSAVFNHEDLKEKVIQAGVSLTEYTGPTSIHTFILEAGRKRGLRVVSLWGHAPQYLQTRNVKVVFSVLRKLIDLTGIDVDLSELEKTSHFFDQQVNHLVEGDRNLQEVISKMEQIYKQTERASSRSGKEEELKKEEKVIYIQAFLKRPEDEEKKEP
jgi:proteasome assembly chaperone (PAC2) family protein